MAELPAKIVVQLKKEKTTASPLNFISTWTRQTSGLLHPFEYGGFGRFLARISCPESGASPGGEYRVAAADLRDSNPESSAMIWRKLSACEFNSTATLALSSALAALF